MSDLLYKKKNTFEEKDDDFIKKAYDYCEGYKAFLEQSYIERPGIETVKKQAEEKGYLPFDFKKEYHAGDKFYHIQLLFSAMSSNILLFLRFPFL